MSIEIDNGEYKIIGGHCISKCECNIPIYDTLHKGNIKDFCNPVFRKTFETIFKHGFIMEEKPIDYTKELER